MDKGRNRGNGAQDTRAVLYVRVSSKEQEQDGFSISAQLKLLREDAHSKGLTVIREFKDDESAKMTGRTGFNEMLTFLRRSSCRIILVEKTDRLYRNFKDYTILEDLDLEIHLVKEGAILSRDSRSHEKFIHGIKLLMAKNYIDNLSEEVRKGMTEKAEQGHWPSWAPVGYRNNPDTHRIEPDPVDGPLIARLFEDAANDRMTLKALSLRAYHRGLRSRRTQERVTTEGIRRILRNPVYWGLFRWGGKLYQGNHEPLISKRLFDEVQDALRVKGKPRRRTHTFAFAGMVTCSCGKRLVGSTTKGRYIYYQCSIRCTPSIKESDLSARFLEHLQAVRIDDEVATWLLTAIKEFDAKRRAEREQDLARHQARQRQVQQTLDQAYDDKLAGRITQEYFSERFSRWQEELAVTADEIRTLERATFDAFKTADALLDLCRRAPKLFVNQTPQEQARLISLVDSNSRWDGVTLTPIYRKPFDMLAEGLQIMSGGADDRINRNIWAFIQTLEKLAQKRLEGVYAELITA